VQVHVPGHGLGGPFAKLPNELVEGILEAAPLQTVSRLSQVTRGADRFVRGNDVLWHRLRRRDHPTFTPPAAAPSTASEGAQGAVAGIALYRQAHEAAKAAAMTARERKHERLTSMRWSGSGTCLL